RSVSSRMIVPAMGDRQPASRYAGEDLPLPVTPRIAGVDPAGRSRAMWPRAGTVAPAGPGYANRLARSCTSAPAASRSVRAAGHPEDCRRRPGGEVEVDVVEDRYGRTGRPRIREPDPAQLYLRSRCVPVGAGRRRRGGAARDGVDDGEEPLRGGEGGAELAGKRLHGRERGRDGDGDRDCEPPGLAVEPPVLPQVRPGERHG